MLWLLPLLLLLLLLLLPLLARLARRLRRLLCRPSAPPRGVGPPDPPCGSCAHKSVKRPPPERWAPPPGAPDTRERL